MNGYTVAVVTLVVVAVLGARRSRTALPQAARWITPLLRYARFSLAALLATRVRIDTAAAGVYHHMEAKPF